MSATASASIVRELGALLGPEAVLPGSTRAYLSDATKSRNLRGKADAIALPADALQVARIVGWCYEHDVPIVPRGGGPHAFNYGVTGAWVTGLEVVLAPGELVRVGGPIRKDVAGYDLKSLLIGSEGTLGVVTAAWVKLIPAPEAALPLAAVYPDTDAGCAAIEAAFASGVVPAALEYLDAGAVIATRGAFPVELPDKARFMVIADADGSAEEAAQIHAELNEVLGENALLVHAPTAAGEIAALWRWRDGASLAVTARRGGKVSEDVVVPLDRLQAAIEQTVEIGRRHEPN